MLKISGIFISFFLILIIFLRIPQDNVGLSSFVPNRNLLSSPRLSQHFLNLLTAIGILMYLVIATLLTLTSI